MAGTYFRLIISGPFYLNCSTRRNRGRGIQTERERERERKREREKNTDSLAA